MGWEVQLTFQVKLHLRDLALLMDIQAYLNGIGKISKGKDYCVFRVRTLKQVTELIKFTFWPVSFNFSEKSGLYYI